MLSRLTRLFRPSAAPASSPPQVLQGPDCARSRFVPLMTVGPRTDFIRSPGAPAAPGAFEQMHAGLQHAVSEHFVPWLLAHRAQASALPLPDLLRAMHRTTAQSGYSGFIDGRGGTAFPGVFVRELPDMRQNPRGAMPLCIFPVAEAPELFEWSEQLRREASREGVTLRFEGLPKDAVAKTQPKRSREGLLAVHTYIPWRFHGAVLERMGTLLDTAVDLEVPRTQRLEALAEYYQLGINAQLFRRINNSLLMAQVNTLLRSEGLRGIGHGILDYQAMILQPEAFKAHFRAALTQRNPSLAG